MGMDKVVSRVVPGGSPVFSRDATLNDSDKSFTVPANKVWCLHAILATIECSATVGNRVMGARITNGAGDIVAIGPRSGAITATQDATYLWEEGGLTSTTVGDLANINDGTTVNVVRLVSGIPSGGYLLPAGYVIRILDVGAIDAAADDMTVVLYYEEYDV